MCVIMRAAAYPTQGQLHYGFRNSKRLKEGSNGGNKSQGKAFTLFMGGLTAACAGIAFFSSGSGKAAFFLGLICLALSGCWTSSRSNP